VIHGLAVADLADQDDVGSLAAGCSERGLQFTVSTPTSRWVMRQALVRVRELDRS